MINHLLNSKPDEELENLVKTWWGLDWNSRIWTRSSSWFLSAFIITVMAVKQTKFPFKNQLSILSWLPSAPRRLGVLLQKLDLSRKLLKETWWCIHDRSKWAPRLFRKEESAWLNEEDEAVVKRWRSCGDALTAGRVRRLRNRSDADPSTLHLSPSITESGHRWLAHPRGEGRGGVRSKGKHNLHQSHDKQQQDANKRTQ